MSILSARTRAGYSQAKLAKAVGVSDAAVCQWETGKQLPRAALLPKIAAVLNCTIDELFVCTEDQKLCIKEVPIKKE